MINFGYRAHCVKNVGIWSFSGPYSVRMRENTDQKNSEYGHFQCSGYRQNIFIFVSEMEAKS